MARKEKGGKEKAGRLPDELSVRGSVQRVAAWPGGQQVRVWRARMEVSELGGPAGEAEGEARDSPAAAVRRAVDAALDELRGVER